MFRRLYLGMFIAGLMAFSAQSSAATPDYVTGVYMCNANTLQIFLQSGNTLVVDNTDTANMNQSMFDKLFAMSMELLASGRQIGYYSVVKTETSCTRSALEINALVITNTP